MAICGPYVDVGPMWAPTSLHQTSTTHAPDINLHRCTTDINHPGHPRLYTKYVPQVGNGVWHKTAERLTALRLNNQFLHLKLKCLASFGRFFYSFGYNFLLLKTFFVFSCKLLALLSQITKDLRSWLKTAKSLESCC